MPPENVHPHVNRLLAALPPDDYQRLLPCLEFISPPVKYILYEPNQPIEYVYFPHSGVASMMAVMADGKLVEVGTVGNEGMVGIAVFLGVEQTAGMAFWQVPGDAMRMKVADFRKEVNGNGALTRLLQRYVQALFVMLAQSSACNTIHPVRQRCARWLLWTHDQVGDNTFQLTHEFLGEMLGVRRASVTEVMGRLQADGLIRYQRGMITILDQAGLEAVACECYQIIRDEYDRMLG